MKIQLLVLSLGVLLSGCAGVRVADVEVATGATDPEAIYIRPFNMNYAGYNDGNHPSGAVRASLRSVAFANILEEELGKLAPAMVISDDQDPPTGWLVEGDIERLNAYSPSALKIHVRVTDYGRGGVRFNPGKAGISTYDAVHLADGRIVYEFDLKGTGSRPGGIVGDTFDMRNAAERMMLALSPDPFRYGYRGTPNQRY